MSLFQYFDTKKKIEARAIRVEKFKRVKVSKEVKTLEVKTNSTELGNGVKKLLIFSKLL